MAHSIVIDVVSVAALNMSYKENIQGSMSHNADVLFFRTLYFVTRLDMSMDLLDLALIDYYARH